LKILLLCALRGSIILYQGEELGLPQVEVPFDQLQDPEAITNWPHTLSRDGARTPMPWSNDGANLGFSQRQPWLPLGATHAELTVQRQDATRDSTLNFTRECLELRNTHPALRLGTMRIREAGERLLVFDREEGDEILRCSFNLSDAPAERGGTGAPQIAAAGDVSDARLGPWSAIIEKLA
jgi:alpha-glucosidase